MLSINSPCPRYDRSNPTGSWVEGNTIVNSGEIGFYTYRFADFSEPYNIDAGLGALNSSGQNRITGSAIHDVLSEGLDVSAANNWWGSATDPSSVLALDGATVVVDSSLTVDPD